VSGPVRTPARSRVRPARARAQQTRGDSARAALLGAALAAYIRAKMAMSAERPDASRVFANELLHGAPVLGELMRTELRAMVKKKAQVIEGWIEAGRMAPVDATHLFFTIWAATQTYADFDVQVRAVLGRARLSGRDHARAADHVVGLVLRGCGLA
jgi:TetR/AcrR family transcriptional regulator